MKLNIVDIQKTLEESREFNNNFFSIRIEGLLEELVDELTSESENVELLDLLIRLIVLADAKPSKMISEMIGLLNSENICFVKKELLPEVSSYLTDYLYSDFTKYLILNKK